MLIRIFLIIASTNIHGHLVAIPVKYRSFWIVLKLRCALKLDDIRICHFCLDKELKMRHILCWKCSLYNLIKDKLPLQIHNIVPGRLKSFLQLDHQVGISLYLVEATALCHCREVVGLKPSRCTFNPIRLFGFLDFEIRFNFIL